MIVGVVCASSVLLTVMFLVWWDVRRGVYYIAPQVGRRVKPLRMVMMSSMRIGADKSGVSSKPNNDHRITPV